MIFQSSSKANKPRHSKMCTCLTSRLLLVATLLPSTSALLSFSSSSPFLKDSPVTKQLQRRGDVPDIGFYDPTQKDDGRFLTQVPVTYPAGLGEPLSAVISAFSDPDVLVDREDRGGLRNYFLSLSFSAECLGQSLGSVQRANLGDGNGFLNETAVIRFNYGDPYVGTCKETINGGNHFRYWVQNGRDASSGAIFLAPSVELPIDLGHDIVRNGYNLGRDWIVGNATGTRIPSPNPLSIAPGPGPEVLSASAASVASVASVLSQSIVSAASVMSVSIASASLAGNTSFLPTPTTMALPTPSPTPTITLNNSGGSGNITAVPGGQYTGSTSFNGYVYETTVTYYSGFMGNTSEGVNHYYTVEQDGRPAMDGLLAVLLVKITQRPPDSAGVIRTGSIPGFAIMSLVSLAAVLLSHLATFSLS